MSYPVERLWNPFLGDSCKTLVNKPKLFFIQACRGENLEKAVEFQSFAVMTRELAPAAAPPQPVTYAIPSTADMLVFYSTFDSTCNSCEIILTGLTRHPLCLQSFSPFAT